MPPRDQDLQYLIRVADQELREAQKLVSALNKEMQRSEHVGASSSAKTASGARNVELAYGRSLKAVVGYGAGIAATYLTIDKGVQFLHESADEAAKLDVQLKNVEATFESSAPRIKEWSRSTTDAILVARQEALAGAAALGALFKSVDFAPSQSAEMSENLVELAAALGLLKGQDPSEVLDRLRTALIGRTGGVRQYAIALTKARIEQKALTLAGKEDADQLTDQEKLLGRYELILEQTAGVHRHAAELAGEHAGQTRKLSAEIKDLQGRIGGPVVSVGGDLARGANNLADAVERLGGTDLPDWWPSFGKDVLNTRLFGGGSGDAFGGKGSPFDAIAGGVGESLGGLVGAFDQAAAEIEKRLRTRLGEALEDVHDKALNVFDRETDALVSAHDSVTDDILDAFDKATAEMVENLTVLVKVGERQFEIGRGKKTPAERELEALEKIERKRNLRREEFDARTALGQAELIGDPAAIRDAKRRLQDTETERKRIKLEARAETEREAADKALEEEERALRESREAQREDIVERRRRLRNDLGDRRRIMRQHLDEELKAIATALEKQKRAASRAQQQIIATLRKYGADYKGVGEELGGKFLEGFADAIDPKLKPKTRPRHPSARGQNVPGGYYLGGIAGQGGRRGPTDTIPAWLTRGEMVLTHADQASLARMLGTRTTGAGLLSTIRMGFAEGGIADERAFRELLEHFSMLLSSDAVSIGRRLGTSGSLSGAERQLLSPIHIQSKVRDGLTAAEKTALGRGGRLKLMGELAQRQAHPARSGLVRYLPTGIEAGGNFRDPFGGAGDQRFEGPMHFNFPNVRSGYEAVAEMRRELHKHKLRNVRRRRGVRGSG